MDILKPIGDGKYKVDYGSRTEEVREVLVSEGQIVGVNKFDFIN